MGTMRRYFLFQMLASLCFAMQKKGKPPDVRVVQASCVRLEVDVAVDGKLVVESARTLQMLQLVIDFLDSDRQLLTSKRGVVSEDPLERGDEPEFHLRVAGPARAVYFRIRAEETEGRDLRVENEGPFAIE